MPRVYLPDGRVLNFPDGMPPAEMEKAITSLGPMPAAPEAPGEPKSIGGFLGNVISSGAGLIRDTAGGVVDVGRNAIELAANPVKFATKPEVLAAAQNPGAVAGAAKEYFGKRYGGLSELGNTLYSDPVGLAADAATVASLGGGLAARGPGVVGRVGRAVAGAGAMADPMALATKGVAAAAPAVGRAGERAGEALYTSALDVSRPLARRNANVNIPRAAAERGVLLSRGSQQRAIEAPIEALENRVGNLITNSDKTINVAKAVDPVRELAAERGGHVPGYSLTEEAPRVDARVAEIFRANEAGVPSGAAPQLPNYYLRRNAPIDEVPHGPAGLRPVPIQQAQATKVALNRRLKQTFGMGGEPPVNVDIQHAERRGLMQAIEEAEPEVAALNKELGPLYAVDAAVEDALARPSQFATQGLGRVANAPVRLVRSPYSKTLTGRTLFRLGQGAPRVGAAVGATGPGLTRLAILDRLGEETPSVD